MTPPGGTPLITEILRGSRVDGPGHRTVIFFKGCPLRCVFCHSPETWRPFTEVAFHPARCIGCGLCAEACERDAPTFDRPGRIRRGRCRRCMACAEACPADALRRVGRYHHPDELARLLLKDRAFYAASGGGVTLSGGEPTLYPGYLARLLPRLEAQAVHVVLETCGHFDYAAFREQVLPHLDLIYFDVKLADPRAHEQHCGVDNQRILANLRRLLRDGVAVQPRVPIIPGVTDSAENLTAIAALLRGMGAQRLQPLAYNPLGLAGYRRLGLPTPALPDRWLTPEEMAEVRRLLHAQAPPADPSEGAPPPAGRKPFSIHHETRAAKDL